MSKKNQNQLTSKRFVVRKSLIGKNTVIPGTKPPYFLKFSAVSVGLNVIDV